MTYFLHPTASLHAHSLTMFEPWFLPIGAEGIIKINKNPK
jgi:hypothetical protein